ncbi:unnamed protein product [Caretta caretta]
MTNLASDSAWGQVSAHEESFAGLGPELDASILNKTNTAVPLKPAFDTVDHEVCTDSPARSCTSEWTSPSVGSFVTFQIDKIEVLTFVNTLVDYGC